MRGSPLIQTLAITLLLAAAGFPVWSLTREKPHAAQPAPGAAKPAGRSIALEITSSAPAAVEIRLAGMLVASSSEPATRQEYHFSAPAGTADLVLTARWENSGSPNAIRLNARQEGDSVADATFWGETGVEDVLTIPAAP